MATDCRKLQFMAVIKRARKTSKVHANSMASCLQSAPNSGRSKPTYAQSLDRAARLGARLKKLEKKDLPR